MSSPVKYKPLSDDICEPKATSRGTEIYAPEDVYLKANVPVIIKSKISMSFDNCYCAIITHPEYRTLGGLIDSDYRGDVGVIFCTAKDIFIKKGELLGLVTVLKIEHPIFTENSDSFGIKTSEVSIGK
ncbi:hypothetical protein A0H76_504 [Hepatospora eriocheir]|uniref:dUTPase-like domain-containing protein n=1 Tax=Hepatospora eriocheir TaxID=1081669 RepID=A0A1X0QL32_9MICR|nr:hypothetical protein A0H76_504 [Hepatospora eriocheir]